MPVFVYMNYKKTLGIKGELAAKNWLIKNNYQIIGTNVKIKHHEIDIIASKNEMLVFFEIKTGNYSKDDYPLKNSQFKSLKKAMTIYCKNNHIFQEKTRLDLIIIVPQGTSAKLEWLANISL